MELLCALLLLLPWSAAVTGNVCVLERLQNEPFWDETVVDSVLPEGRGDPGTPGICRCQSGFTGPYDTPPWMALKDWQTVRQYLAPLAFVPYSQLAREQVVWPQAVEWRYPSWQAPEGPSHETMTISDGLSSMVHAVQHYIQKPGGRSTCLQDIDCAVAIFLIEMWRVARTSLATDRVLDLRNLAKEWPSAAWPWEELIQRGWGPALVGSLLVLAGLLREEPMTHWNQISDFAHEARSEEFVHCCSWDALQQALLEANSSGQDRFVGKMARAPALECCGSIRRWLRTGLPSLQLAQTILLPRQHLLASNSMSIDYLTHKLCNSVETIHFARGSILLHVHGASVFRGVDKEGRLWHHIEVLHFVSSRDDCVRVTTFGKTASERHYYAHALTLPSLSHLARWRCALGEADVRQTGQARSASFFGYDAVMYCSLPAADDNEPEGVLNVKLDAPNIDGWSVPALKLCPVTGVSSQEATPPHPLRGRGPFQRFRLAACTEPLHNYDFFRATAPNLLDEFIEYHVMLGIEHFTIFDTEGSFEEPLNQYVSAGTVDYVPRWPAVFGGEKYSTVASERSIVVEVEAENYCLWHYRGRADWVAVLHSPDEFLYMPQEMAPTGKHGTLEGNVEGSLLRFLARLESQRSKISHIEVRQVPYGGPAEASPTVMGRYVHRTAAAFDAPHTLIANVLNIAQLGVHPGRPRPAADGEDPLFVVNADPLADLRVNHYINSIGGRERCPLKLCDTHDESAVWVSQLVESRLQHRK